MQEQIFISVPLEEFENLQKRWMREVLSESYQKTPPPNTHAGIYGTRKEVAKELRISLPTLSEYSRKGLIKGYNFGRRILFKWEEIPDALKAIEVYKFKCR